LRWYVFFEQPLSTALQPVYSLLFRTAWLLALGVLLAVLSGVVMARNMVVPIRALQVGAQQLEASDFGHRIDARTGDEIEDLANYFNRMADQLQGSYSALEQKVAERTRDLAQSVGELKALEEIGRAVASSLDTKSVLATIVTRAVELTHADAGAIYRYDASRDAFGLAEAYALDPAFQDSVRGTRIGLDESVLGLAAKQREPICVPDLARAPNYPLRDITLAAGFHSVLVVPLLGQDESSELVAAPGDRGFREHSRLMRTTDQSALAMNNARLFREVEQKARACRRQRTQGSFSPIRARAADAPEAYSALPSYSRRPVSCPIKRWRFWIIERWETSPESDQRRARYSKIGRPTYALDDYSLRDRDGRGVDRRLRGSRASSSERHFHLQSVMGMGGFI
jgi:adenylate cyclase